MTAPKPAPAGGVDVCADACLTCGQTNIGQTGEHPCTACGLPALLGTLAVYESRLTPAARP